MCWRPASVFLWELLGITGLLNMNWGWGGVDEFLIDRMGVREQWSNGELCLWKGPYTLRWGWSRCGNRGWEVLFLFICFWGNESVWKILRQLINNNYTEAQNSGNFCKKDLASKWTECPHLIVSLFLVQRNCGAAEWVGLISLKIPKSLLLAWRLGSWCSGGWWTLRLAARPTHSVIYTTALKSCV